MAKPFLASAAIAVILVIVTGWLWLQSSPPSVANDFEECAEQAEAALPAQRPALMTNCGARFAGRRKPGGGYTYFDFMQNRNFDIAGPNPTADERKQIDREYIKYLDVVRRDIDSAKLAEQQNGVADLRGAPPTVGKSIGPPLVLTPKKVPSAKSAASQPKTASEPCLESSFVCSWQNLTTAVRNAFASSSKPE